jgi:predicted phosphohydrolase
MRLLKYISDLHIERKINPIYFKKNDMGGNIFLAGDIGSPLENKYWIFLDYLAYNFDNVFFTSGNHEYWNNKSITINEINDNIKNNVTKHNNLHFLNNNKISFDGYDILGTVLWSHPNTNLYNSIDFNNIYYKRNQKLTPKIMRKLFYKNKLWLENNININNNPKIIMTHYLPSYKFTKKYKKYIHVESIFASDLEYLINDPVKLWIFGHTHDNFTKYINNIPCTVNALGYKNKININKINIK